MTGIERILKTLQHEEPDRIPTFEIDIDRRVIDRIMPEVSYEKFIEKMDIDGLIMYETRPEKYNVIDESNKILRNKWGAVCKLTDNSEYWPDVLEPVIKKEKDVDNYTPPDPDTMSVYPIIEEWIKRYKGERAVIAHLIDPATVVREFLLGFEEYCIALKKNPELVERLNEITGEYYMRYIKNCVELGVDAVMMSTDLASSMGLLYSPDDISKFILPNLKKINGFLKNYNIPSFRHTDGNIWPIFDMLIDAGYDGIHPIDPSAGMDLGEAKKKYGDKVTLMGNVDCVQTLPNGTIDNVREDVKRCIRQAAKGGGYICMTSNTVHIGVKPENYKVMLEAIKEYGRYPISI